MRFLGHAAVSTDGQQLAFAREEVLVRWLEKRGMRWNRVLPGFHHFAKSDRPPDVLVLYVGGNDLGALLFRELI